MKKSSRFILMVVVVVLALSGIAFLPAASAQAASNSGTIVDVVIPTRTPRVDGQRANEQLSLALQQELNWLTRQKIHLTQANQAALKAQQLIDRAKADGKDVSALEAALASFKSQVAAAQASHDQAASILAAKSGFDANNQVTDLQMAHQTVVGARDALRQAHLTLQKAILDLRSALQDWRIQHRQS